MIKSAKIVLKPGKEKSIQRFHPWLFSGAIKRVEGRIKEGDIAEVFDSNGNFLATGHYQIGSIAVRIFSFQRTDADNTFWKNKLLQAYSLRQKAGLADSHDTNVYRLVNGEGDGFPGMIIDWYNGIAVMQFHSIGMYFLREKFAEILKEIYADRLRAVYDKSEETLPHKAGINPQNGYISGGKSENIIIENGLKYNIDVEGGQKTGFFIDQRENRKLLERYAKDKTVLNAFCYTGGFSVSALKGKAKLVHSVDSSEKAIHILNKNIKLNFGDITNHQSYSSDVFDFLNNIISNTTRNKEPETRNSKYDLIILDPPAFGKHLDVIENAIKGYRNLNRKAFEVIKPGGILFTFSCSQVVSREHFRTAIFSAAAIAGREVKILHQLFQPADHPINIYHPEGEYLKGLVLAVL